MKQQTINRPNCVLPALLLLLMVPWYQCIAQSPLHEIDIPAGQSPKLTALNFSGTNPAGITLGVNNSYFVRNGKPWFPLMGEFHFTRFPYQYWEEEILKMKAGGLTVVATYIFWNSHENPKGTWNWENNKNLRYFLQLCQKHGLYVWLRIGPWSHGEQLNGGFPEWIENMPGKRKNDPGYLAEAKKLFDQIGLQTRHQFFNEGGPVIGVQLENEYADGEKGHIGLLEQMAIDAGIKPVYFSITANTVFDEKSFEAIPLQGAYPYRGWEKAGGGPTKDFLYANDQWIMEADLGHVFYDPSKFPGGLCEQGCGGQMTYNNRFIVDPHVVEAHLQNQVGRGINEVGYYMYQGGTQEPGLKEPGLPESYDFQAPLGEYGLPRESYKYLKILHHFLNDFGTELAAMKVIYPRQPVRNELNTDSLRYVIRTNGKNGYVFLCNTQVRINMPDKLVHLRVKLASEQIDFPEFKLPGQTAPVFPFNLQLNATLIKYATMQPLARFRNNGIETVFLYAIPGIKPEIAFKMNGIKSMDASGWDILTRSGIRVLSFNGKSRHIRIVGANGKRSNIVLLTRKEAEESWRSKINGQEVLMLSDADLTVDKNSIELRQLADTAFTLSVYPADITKKLYANGKPVHPDKSGLFAQFSTKVATAGMNVIIDKIVGDTATILLPQMFPKQLTDVFLNIGYDGGEVSVKLDNKIVADHLYHGPSWLFGLKRYIGAKELIMNVQPWTDNITGVEDRLVKEINMNATKFTTIKKIPQYRVLLSTKNLVN